MSVENNIPRKKQPEASHDYGYTVKMVIQGLVYYLLRMVQANDRQTHYYRSCASAFGHVATTAGATIQAYNTAGAKAA